MLVVRKSLSAMAITLATVGIIGCDAPKDVFDSPAASDTVTASVASPQPDMPVIRLRAHAAIGSSETLDQMAAVMNGPAIVFVENDSRVITQFADLHPATEQEVAEAAKNGITIFPGQEIGSPGIVNTLYRVRIEWLHTGEVQRAELAVLGGQSGAFIVESDGPSPAPGSSYVMFLGGTSIESVFTYDPLYFDYNSLIGKLDRPSVPTHPLAQQLVDSPVSDFQVLVSGMAWHGLQSP